MKFKANKHLLAIVTRLTSKLMILVWLLLSAATLTQAIANLRLAF